MSPGQEHKIASLPEGGAEEGAAPLPALGSEAGALGLPPCQTRVGVGWGGMGRGGHDTQRAVQTFGGHSVRRHPHAAAGRRGSQTTRTLPSVT